LRRSDAYKLGVKIYDGNTGRPVSPEQARGQAMDKAAYDQNYECTFASETGALLTHELINGAAEGAAGIICEQTWSDSALPLLMNARHPLYAGCDVARRRDFTFVPVGEFDGDCCRVLAALRMRDLRLPEQKRRLEPVISIPNFKRIAIDMTGIGLGLFEFTEEKFPSKVIGVDFSTSVAVTKRIQLEGRKAPTVKVTEAMAMDLLGYYEDRRIKHPCDAIYRDDLRKPERVTTPGGRVSIAATRDEAGHADHFWGNALMIKARNAGPSWLPMPRAFSADAEYNEMAVM
jgi:phage FluMu gp28-like protein